MWFRVSECKKIFSIKEPLSLSRRVSERIVLIEAPLQAPISVFPDLEINKICVSELQFVPLFVPEVWGVRWGVRGWRCESSFKITLCASEYFVYV